jgi:hypothetical protein
MARPCRETICSAVVENAGEQKLVVSRIVKVCKGVGETAGREEEASEVGDENRNPGAL